MSSMQSRPASQRRPSPEQPSTSSNASDEQMQSQRARSQSRARSASSEDSQTVVLNKSSIIRDQEQQEEPSHSAPPQRVEEPDVKKCWICFSDETEDTPESSEWRDPCPCALVAHEACLLDWIADMESPSSRKRTLSPPRPVCPQCKTDIHLARPKNYLVESVKALERVSAKVTTPGILMVAMSTIVNACEAHGRYSIMTIFGPRDGLRIMQPVLFDMLQPREVRSLGDIKYIFGDLLQHWRLRIGLPLITPILVLSRTTLADSLLPVLPIVFFATQGDSDVPLDFASWPPSASLAMAVLPYLRGAYNAYYEKVWAEKEKRWLKEIQPRSGVDNQGEDVDNQDAADQGDNAEAAEDEANFEVRIDAGIWEDWGGNNNNNNEDDAQPQAAPPLNAPPLADNDVFGNQNQQGGAPNPPPPQQQQRQPQENAGGDRQERLLSFSTTALAEKVLGALFFPTIASASGELLAHLLPRAWTTRPLGGARGTGLLQEKWGRSIVGGCLFVVVKDAVMLYVRWKMAMQHRRRRVLDYDRTKKKVKG